MAIKYLESLLYDLAYCLCIVVYCRHCKVYSTKRYLLSICLSCRGGQDLYVPWPLPCVPMEQERSCIDRKGMNDVDCGPDLAVLAVISAAGSWGGAGGLYMVYGVTFM